MNKHDELLALVEKWREEKGFCGDWYMNPQSAYLRAYEKAANELEAILSAPVEVAEAQAEWLKPLFEVYYAAWHFLDYSGQFKDPGLLEIDPERRDALEAALAAFEVALPPKPYAMHVLWEQLAPQQRAGSEEGDKV